VNTSGYRRSPHHPYPRGRGDALPQSPSAAPQQSPPAGRL